MVIITVRKGSRAWVKSYPKKDLRFWYMVFYYKLRGYEVKHD